MRKRRIFIAASFAAAVLAAAGRLYLVQCLSAFSRSNYEQLSTVLYIALMAAAAAFFGSLFYTVVFRNKINGRSVSGSIALFAAFVLGYGTGTFLEDRADRFYETEILSDCSKTQAAVAALTERRAGKDKRVKLARISYTAARNETAYQASVDRGNLLPGDSLTVCFYNANPAHFILPESEVH